MRFHAGWRLKAVLPVALVLLAGLAIFEVVTLELEAPQRVQLLAVAAGDNVVRLLPPLIIGEEEIAEAIVRLDRACARLGGAARSQARSGSPKPELSFANGKAKADASGSASAAGDGKQETAR